MTLLVDTSFPCGCKDRSFSTAQELHLIDTRFVLITSIEQAENKLRDGIG